MPGSIPLTVQVTRVAFFGYFAFALITLFLWPDLFKHSELTLTWLSYQVILWGLVDLCYRAFHRRGIDMSTGYAITLVAFCLNLGTDLLGGQEQLPLLNRAEHFISFVLLGYLVWIFFMKYLPPGTWDQHPYYTALTTLSVTALFGVVNEIVELGLDFTFGTSTIGGRFDTPLDLLMNTLGTGLFLAFRLGQDWRMLVSLKKQNRGHVTT